MYRPAKSTSQSVMTIVLQLFALSIISGTLSAAQTTFISQGSLWKYLDNGSDQGTGWRLLSFDDSAWNAGNAQLGYGDGDEATVVSFGPDSNNKYCTTYFRKVFSVTNASSYSSLVLRILRDDGAVAYLNGTEICRTNMLAGAVLYTTFAQSAIDDNIFYEFTVNPALLVEGDNILAVEVHQANATSTDLCFDLSLTTVDSIIKGPYLIYPGGNSTMTVLWQLDAAKSCIFEWGTDTTYALGSVNTSEYNIDHQHKYTITNLVPSNRYYYRITADGDSSTGNFFAAPADDADSVSFLAYGDTRTNVGSHDSLCAEILATIAAEPEYQTLLLHVGDWVNSGDSELSWTNEYFPKSYANILGMQSQLPISGCIGNHEGSGVLFKKYWPYPFVANRYYWSFDYGPVHIAIIDQYVSYTPGSAQYIWLENDLATSDKHWKFIVLHEPGWSAGGGHPNNTSVQNYIQPLCEKYGVQIVFGGHNHYYARAEVNHVTHLTTGAGGAPLATPDPGYPYLQATSKSLEFCKVKIQDNYLHIDVVTPNGSIIDTLDILRGDFPPHDGCVNLTDLAALCSHWLETNCGNCGGTSLIYDGKIDIADLDEFCRLWLTCLP